MTMYGIFIINGSLHPWLHSVFTHREHAVKHGDSIFFGKYEIKEVNILKAEVIDRRELV